MDSESESHNAKTWRSVLFPVALLLQMQLEKMNIRKKLNYDAFEPMERNGKLVFIGKINL